MILHTIPRIVSVALATSVTLHTAAQVPPAIVQESVWVLEVDVVAIGPGTEGSLAKFSVTASRRDPGIHETALGAAGGWPGGALRLTAAIDRVTDDEATFDFVADLTRPGRPVVRTARRFALHEAGSQLIEIFGEGERRLLVSMRGEEGTRPVFRRIASAGARVLLRVEIERIDGERVVPLESNDLNTFVGEPVEYSFDFGGDGERLRLVLTPVSVTGSLVQIRAQVSGQLPGASGPVILSRDQMFAASEGATSSVEVVVGDPPRGYRFRVTPDF